MACKTINDLSHDVLLILVQCLSPSSKVCLALTSHFFQDFVRSVTNKKLKDIITPPPFRRLFSLSHPSEHARLMRQLVTFIPYSRIQAHLRNMKDGDMVGCWCPDQDGLRCWRVDCSFERGWELSLREEYEDQVLAVKKKLSAYR